MSACRWEQSSPVWFAECNAMRWHCGLDEQSRVRSNSGVVALVWCRASELRSKCSHLPSMRLDHTKMGTGQRVDVGRLAMQFSHWVTYTP